MEEINLLTYGLVFLGGILSFFSPCVIPLIPIYMSYLSGSAKDVDENGQIVYVQRKVLFYTVFFILGISFAFFILGFSFTALGGFFIDNKEKFSKIGGAIIILLGLFQLGIIKLTFLQRERKLHIDTGKMSPLVAFITGFTFSFAWTPCIGPLLSSVLIVASGSEERIVGNLLVLFYALGFVLPFLLLGAFTTASLNFLRRNQKLMKYTIKLGGILLIVIGTLTFTGKMSGISTYFSNPIGFLSQKTYAAGMKAPDFKVKANNGEEYQLSDLKGKVVFLNFFTTQCKYCQEELPYLKEMYKEYGRNKKDVVFISVMNPKTEKYKKSVDVTIEEVIKYLNEKNFYIPTVLDAPGVVFKAYRVTGYPTNFVINKNGEIFKYLPGAQPKEVFEKYIDEALEE